jgi:hypothetical protein
VAGERVWLLGLGLVLVAGGLAWLLIAGADPAAIFADPGPSSDDTTAALPVGVAVLPGLVCIGLWLRAAFRLRVLLARASSAPIELVFQQRLACLVPSHVLACYRFTDTAGVEHEAHQTVRAGSPEGRGLWAGGRGLVAMFDPDDPAQCHLVSEQRFADP